MKLGDEVTYQPTPGRLIVFLISEKSQSLLRQSPVNGPFWNDPQPLYGIDTTLTPDTSAVIDDASDSFPVPLSQLPPGKYRAQARLDISRRNSDWRRETGNLWSDPIDFEIADPPKTQAIELVLTRSVSKRQEKQIDGVEWFEIRSELLSAKRGYDVVLRAGVIMPLEFDPQRKYPTIYEVPGFGGDHTSASAHRIRSPESPAAELAKNSFKVVLDPEGPNGHTLFVDSENNGPCGEALVTELIPALEAKYPLISKAEARVLRGHSSGGWSTLWLALRYPEVFGATWSSAPDPVDFRKFQKVNIYQQKNFYTDSAGDDLPSYRSNSQVKMTIRQESRGEDILGPDNTSAQQWDSWFAAFGPRNDQGNPAALFDPKSGIIDDSVASQYRRFDIADLIRNNPTRYIDTLRNRVRLVVGTEDSFYLNEAVELLAEDARKLGAAPTDKGYIKMIPGDHGSIMASETMRAMPKEMLEHFRESGCIP